MASSTVTYLLPKPANFQNLANPNRDLLKNVAIIRGLINFILRELGKEPFDFQPPVTASILKQQYLARNKRKTDKALSEQNQ